jgi:tRNA threonylcarbamoyladenosine biosynthesis protein TsaB
MKILAMETSTSRGSVSLVVDGQLVCEESIEGSKSHSENITTFIEACLKKSNTRIDDIDVFATGMGPGSFTGIRIAANAAKTLSFAFNKPLVAIDSLTLLAKQVENNTLPIVTIINAYKNMVYFGMFSPNNNSGLPVYLKGPEAIPVRNLNNFIDRNCIVVGDGWTAFHEYFPEDLLNKMSRPDNSIDTPCSSTLGLLAYHKALEGQTLDWKSFAPLYIRASEAEEIKKGILITPLK